MFSLCAYCHSFGHSISRCSHPNLSAFGILCEEKKESLQNSIFMFHYWISCYINADTVNMRTMKYYCIRYCNGRLQDSVDVLSRKIANRMFDIRDQEEGRERDFIPFTLPTTIYRNQRHINNMFEPRPVLFFDNNDETKIKKEIIVEIRNIGAEPFDCPICLETKEVDAMRLTSCQHSFCAPCLDKIFDYSIYDCSMCRETIHTIYKNS